MGKQEGRRFRNSLQWDNAEKHQSLPSPPTLGTQYQCLWHLIVFSMQMKPLGFSGGGQTSDVGVLEELCI